MATFGDEALQDLRDLGNSVIVVEHDKEMMLSSDFILDIGPGPGLHGGHIVAEGSPKEFLSQKSLTADFLKNKPCLQCLNVAIGWADIELEFVINNINEIDQLINEINIKYPNSIRKYSFWIAEKVYKNRWLPEIYKM